MSKKRDRKSKLFTMRLKPAWRQKLDSLATEQEATCTQIMFWALREYWQKYGPRGNGNKAEE